MKIFTAVCLSLAVLVGASVQSAAACGGQGGATGCKVATMPLTTENAVWFVRWLELLIP